MQQPDKFKAYAALVCEQLRWKRARPVVEREIKTHLRDQYDALVKDGLPEEQAVEESIRQMGDAVEIGTDLDRVHRPKPSWGLLILTGILLLAGLGIHIFLTYDSNFPYMLRRHVLAAIVGVGCLAGAYFMDFTILGKRPLLFFIGAVVLVGCVTAFDPQTINFRSYTAAQLTLLLPLAYTALLYWLRGKGYLGLVLAIGGLAVQCVCCCIIPFSAGLLITAVTGVVLLAVAVWENWFQIGKARGLFIWGILVLLAAVAGSLFIWSSSYAASRVELAFHPELDPEGNGFLGMVIRETLAGAQLLGEGVLGAYAASMQLNHTDFLLTYLICRIGWISFIVIMAVFVVFFAAAAHKCLKQKNMLGRLASLAVILTLALQVLFYVCFNLGICLFGSISLPLISYGNTPLVVNMALIGVMLSTFRTGVLVRDGETPLPSGARRFRWKDRFRWNDGVLTISFKKNIAS